MEQHRQERPQQEPAGIIISRGERGDVAPRFWAYVWSDAPDAPAEPVTQRAA